MPRVEGKKVVLREFLPQDVPVIHAWVNDPLIVRFLSWAIFPQTQRETERFVETQMGGEDPMNRAFVISLRDNDLCIGTTGLINIDWRNRSGDRAHQYRLA